jgi:hypothetical protein
MIDLAVRLMPLRIFVCILAGGNSKNNQEGEDHQSRGDGGEFAEELQDSNPQKEAGKV